MAGAGAGTGNGSVHGMCGSSIGGTGTGDGPGIGGCGLGGVGSGSGFDVDPEPTLSDLSPKVSDLPGRPFNLLSLNIVFPPPQMYCSRRVVHS